MRGESYDASTFTQIGTQIIQPPAARLEVRYSLPPDTTAFTGRDQELRHITAGVTAAAGAGGTGAVHAIGGMPGVGKTALAVRVAHLLQPRFPDRQLFIDLHGHTPGQDPVSPATALAGLLAAVGVDGRNLPADVEERTSLWRDRMAGQRALLVLDNAASTAQVVPLLPGGERCMVLITSRRHLGDLPAAAVPVLVDALPPGKAQEMFLRLAPQAARGPEAAVRDLVQLAGCLPLAISLLARVYLRHPSWTLADLIGETKASMLTLTAEKDSIAAAFEVSYRHLAPGQQQFFRRLGLHPGTTIDAYAAAVLSEVSLSEVSLQVAGASLDALHGEGLLTETGFRRYGMHDLIRCYARDSATADSVTDRERGLERLLDYYQHTAAISQARLARQTRAVPAAAAVTSPPTAAPDLPDHASALSWARTERNNVLACLDHATRAGWHTRVVALTAGIAAILRQDGPWTEAMTRHATAVQAACHLGDRQGHANALSDLATIRWQIGDYRDAVEALETALDICRDLGDRLGEANALHCVGVVRRETAEYPAAASALETALSIYRDLDNRLGEANALNCLGRLRQATGEYRAADEAHEAALGISCDLGDWFGQANAFKELGAVRRRTGHYEDAAESLEAALDICRDLGNRGIEATVLEYQGAVRRLTGNYHGATESLQAALNICCDIGDRLGQAYALKELGTVRRLTGNHEGASQSLMAALGICRNLGDRAAEAEALNELGTLHRILGDQDQAMSCHLQSLGLAREINSSWDEANALVSRS
jgi:tetratricopeptide (TPR) repeat protein